MKNRGLRSRTAISNAVDTKLWNEFKNYSNRTGIPISKLLDRAVELFLNSIKK